MGNQRPKDRFFEKMDAIGLALAYGDVRLNTGYSAIRPEDADTRSQFSRRVSVRIPLISSAMDTVTKNSMAIAIAKGGGLGIIHRNLTPKEQKDEVVRVKLHMNGLITSPIFVRTIDKLEHILNMRT